MTTQTAAFRPFESHLDEARAREVLRTATQGAEDGELFIERRRSESLVLDDRRVRRASHDAGSGFGLRVVAGEATGYAHSTELSDAALARAGTAARLAATGAGGTLADGPTGSAPARYDAVDPLASTSFAGRIALLREIDSYVRDMDNRVVQVTVSLAASVQEVTILRPEGAPLTDMRPMARLDISVILDQDGRRESGSAGGGGRIGLDGVIGAETWQTTAAEALRIARVNLEAIPAPAGIFDIVLGNGWPGILLHEAIGHGLEGDFNRKGSSAFAGLMGQRIAAPGVTVLDDGTLTGARGSLTIDDEGTPSSCTPLIEDGILTGFMQDRLNARLMGVPATGNGRRESYAHQPMPRMTNTYMLGGDTAPEALVADLTDGIYAVGFGGGQVDITNGKFVFSCTEAYRVENGRVGAPLKGATLIGDGATALTRIRGVGNDMALDSGRGTCGKAGQSVPVGVGQPSLLIGGLTIGGAAT